MATFVIRLGRKSDKEKSENNFMRATFPFTAIVGQERMIRALVLNAINPRIGGVLIRGERGTAKSTSARALAALLPEIEVFTHSPFNDDPSAKADPVGAVQKNRLKFQAYVI